MEPKDLKLGERGRIRTCDPCLKRALLYHLSYAPTLGILSVGAEVAVRLPTRRSSAPSLNIKSLVIVQGAYCRADWVNFTAQ